ncbi:type II secretion system F family protein [bacterium]|nr:type II secretion system F family protein [bacterium]
MPTFEFKAVTPNGTVINETLEAANPQSARSEIAKRGYRAISVKEKAAEGGIMNADLFAKKVKVDEIVLFTQELVTLLKAGVPLLTSIEALSSQSSKEFGTVLNKIYVDVMSGKSFSQALDGHPKVFTKLYVNSVRAGEVSGSMDDVLSRMAMLLKKDEELKKQVKSALRYPIIVVCAMLAAFFIIMLKVMPNFTKMFAKMKMDLPLPTRILMATSDFVQANFVIIFILLATVISAFLFFIRTEKGRFWWDGVLMKMPITGNLVIKSAMARFTKMFETLNRSGLPIIQTLNTVSTAVGNVVIESMIKEVALNIEKGNGIAGSMKKFDLFPPMVVRMISIGEQSGSLDSMLESIADHYEVEVGYAVKGLVAMIEPLLTVVMGGAVVVMALAIFLPMWNMVGAVQHK